MNVVSSRDELLGPGLEGGVTYEFEVLQYASWMSGARTSSVCWILLEWAEMISLLCCAALVDRSNRNGDG